MKPALAIMAAGLGSRYGGFKQIEPIGLNGELLIEYSVYDAIKAGFGRVVFIVNQDLLEDFKTGLGAKISRHIPVSYVCQRMSDCVPADVVIPADRVKPWGTGHAVLCLLGAVDVPFCVINADDYYGFKAFELVCGFLRTVSDNKPHECCMAAFNLGNTLSEHGSVSRGVCRTDGSGRLSHIVERTKIRMSGGVITDENTGTPIASDAPVSMNFWGFPAGILPDVKLCFDRFLNSSDLSKAEFFLPSVVDQLLSAKAATVDVLPTDSKWFGMTYREDREPLRRALSDMRDKGLYPQKLWK